MSLDNVLVRPHRAALERYSTPEAWQRIDAVELEALEALAALPSPAADSDVEALRFDLLVHRHELAQLTGEQHNADRLQATIQQIADALLTQLAIPRVAAQAALLERVADDEWWIDLPLRTLEDARRELRDLLRFMPRTRRKVVQADFQDIMLESAQIDLVPSNIGVDIERFRQKAGDYLRAHEDELVVQRLRRNKPLTGSDLQRLEEMLVAAGGEQAHIEWVQKNVGGLGLFVRELVGLDRAAAQEAFAQFLEKGNFTVYHIRFVDLIVEELTRNGRMEPARLFESPFTDHAPLGPESLFAADQVEHIVEILADVERHALVLGA